MPKLRHFALFFCALSWSASAFAECGLRECTCNNGSVVEAKDCEAACTKNEGLDSQTEIGRAHV